MMISNNNAAFSQLLWFQIPLKVAIINYSYFHAVLGIYNYNSYSCIVLMLQKVVNGTLLMNSSV